MKLAVAGVRAEQQDASERQGITGDSPWESRIVNPRGWLAMVRAGEEALVQGAAKQTPTRQRHHAG